MNHAGVPLANYQQIVPAHTTTNLIVFASGQRLIKTAYRVERLPAKDHASTRQCRDLCRGPGFGGRPGALHPGSVPVGEVTAS